MDRRLPLLGLVMFVVLTGASIVVSGLRSGPGQGDAPWVLQVVGYLFALWAGALLTAHGQPEERRIGLVVLVTLVVLVLIDAWTWDDLGADIGLGLVRVVCLVVMAGATVRVVRRPGSAVR